MNGLFEEVELEEGTFPDFNTGMLSTAANGNKKNHPTDEKQAESESKKPFFHPEKSSPDGELIGLQDTLTFAAMLDKRGFGPANPELQASRPAEAQNPQMGRQTLNSEEVTGQHFFPESIIQAGHTKKATQGGRPFLWSIAILCLLATALAQTVWFVRDDLVPYPEVRELLEFVCTQADCKLPPWREPQRFNISSRSVRTHPMNDSALQIQLVFSNTARFAQPYPQLQLQLYDINEKLSAQRVFHPDEYLAEPQNKAPLIGPAQSVEVDMALADPGAGVTGFKIEFL